MQRDAHATGGSTRPLPHGLSLRAILLRLLGLGLFIGAVAAMISSLPGLGTLRHRFMQADATLLVVMLLLRLVSCLSHVVAFRDVFSRRLTWRFSYNLAMAEQATNVLLPTGGAGGLAVGAWALHDEGMSSEKIARRSVAFFVLTSLPNFICVGIAGIVLLTGAAGSEPTVATALLTGAAWVAMIAVAALPRLLHRIHPGRARHGWSAKLRSLAVTLGDGIADVGEFLTPRHWPAVLGAIGWLVFDIATLRVAYAAFDTAMPLGPLVFAYTVGQLGGLIPLPAGIGGTDGGMIGALVLYGSPISSAAAAVLAYRAFQLGVPAALGTIAFFRLRHVEAVAEPHPSGGVAAAAAAEPGHAARV